MRRNVLPLVLLSCAALLGCVSCQSIPYTVTKRSDIDKAIATARAETETKMASIQEQQSKVLRDTIATHEAREQGAANYLFKGYAAFSTLKDPEISRPTRVMGQSIQQTAAQLPPATPSAQAEAFKALQTELDEVKTSTAALKAQYEAELGKARAEGDAKAKVLADLSAKTAALEAEKAAVLGKALTTEQSLQRAKDEVQDKDLAAQARDAEEAKRNEKVKMWLIGTLLVAAAACGVGAAFVPIPSLKKQLIVGAAVCGGAALAIPFITPWMVWCALGVCLLPVVFWTVKTYRDEHNDATDTIRALQEVKVKDPATFKASIAPVLKEWQTNPDTAKRIDERLKQVGDL